ncbi:MAG TPA: YqgE/AlgH family protein [Tessaracoccus flavescens]|uniref:YqgE/AlgH family protein n=1 Tax=Tessaracoccus flavescens TaxID=399497 RepID=A0A921JPK6_9ACTN|nr:YqgE/AlgH family protein [Tessaracoccus flavescens]
MHAGAVAVGQLLVATQPGDGGYFDRTVILLIEHHAEATVGVCLNVPPDPDVIETLQHLSEGMNLPSTRFSEGGPVNREALVTLAEPATPESPPPGWDRISGDIGVVDASFPPELLATSFQQLRVFVGLSAWSPGQLEGELIRGSWFRAPVRHEDVFGDPDGLWRRVLRRMGGSTGRWSTWAEDPTLN